MIAKSSSDDSVSGSSTIIDDACSSDPILRSEEQLDQALATQAERLQGVLTASGVATWEWHFQTGKITINASTASMIGYSIDELEPITIETLLKLCHPEDMTAVREAFRLHLKGERDIYATEMRLRHKDGHWVSVQDRGRIVERDQQGVPIWVFGAYHDITPLRERARIDATALAALRKLTDQVPGAIFQCQRWADGRTTFLFGSQGFVDMFNVDLKSIKTNPSLMFERVHPVDFPVVCEAALQSFSQMTLLREEFRVSVDGAGYRWIECVAKPEKMSDNSVMWHGYCLDKTEHKFAVQKLAEAASVFQYSHDGISITDTKGTIIDVNDAFCELTGYTHEQLVGQNPRILKSGEHDRAFYDAMYHSVQTKGFWRGEITNRRQDGKIRVFKQTLSTVYDDVGVPMRYVALISDVTDRKRDEQQLRKLADYDALTGLPNRQLLSKKLTEAIDSAATTGVSFAVGYIDLDGFKAVNDTYGHAAGDEVLKIIGDRLRHSLRDHDTLARVGGDEFVAIILLEEAQGPLVFDRVLNAAKKPIRMDGITHHLSGSLGISWFDHNDRADGDLLMRQADQAMYEAKQAGRNCYRVFDAGRDRSVRQLNTLFDEVVNGLTSDEFVLYYQPKVDMGTGEVVGVEALIRWQHPQRGFLAPGAFMPELEGRPVMLTLALWVIDRVAAQIEAWNEAGLNIPVSVNIDSYTLLEPVFVEQLRECVGRHPRVDAWQIELEVLETSALADIGHVQNVIEKCKGLGIGFAIDDFGTGYSSLAYLKHLPVTTLKIDASFVSGMLDDTDDLAIIDSIMTLANAFNRQVVAEGVETLAHGSLLRVFDCQFAQGYAIARPMPAAELANWKANWRLPEQWRNQSAVDTFQRRVVFAAIEHMACMKQLVDFLQSVTTQPPNIETSGARVADWISRGDASAQYPERCATVLSLYGQLQLLAEQVSGVLERGDPVAREYIFEQLVALHTQLVEQLESLTGVPLRTLVAPLPMAA